MKNICKKGIFVIALCLIVTLLWIKEASANESHSLTIKNPYTTATVSGEWEGTLEDAEAEKLATDTGKEVCFIANMTYDNTDPLGSEMCGEIIRIDNPAKCSVAIEVMGVDVEKTVQFAIFNSEDAEEKVWEKPIVVDWFASNRVETGGTSNLLCAYPKKGSQYLVIKTDKSADTFVNNIQIKITCYVSSAMDLETGEWYAIGSPEHFSSEPKYNFTIDSDANVTFETKEPIYFHLESKEIRWDQVPRKTNQTLEKYDYKKTYSLEKGTYQFVPEIVCNMKAGFRVRIIVEKHKKILKENQWKTIYPQADNPATIYKIVPKQNGYLTFTLKDEEGYDRTAKIHLRDKRDYGMSPQMPINMKKEHLSEQVFAVKKGQVYYLNFSYGKDKVAFKYTFTEVKEKSGKNMQTAKTVKRNKRVSGTIVGDISSTNEPDWYKINLNKSKKLKIMFNGTSAKKLKAIIYDKNGKIVKKIGCIADGKLRETVWKSNKKLSKGSYYIKIYPGAECATGHYSLKWK